MKVLPLLLLWVVTACHQLPVRPDLPHENAAMPEQSTVLDQLIGPVEARHPARSAFGLLMEGTEAFVMRARSAQLATRSLDVQTYIWHADLTGLYLAFELLEAADRGVRVRVLIDDLDGRRLSAELAAMDAHPNIAVRTFNPFASRRGRLAFLSEGFWSFRRINHRMHNKSWIADNRLAIVGGRNLGNEYFGAAEETNFADLDFALLGPIVREASATFDAYWNSPAAYPIAVLDAQHATPAALEHLRARLTAHAARAADSVYARALRSDDAVRRLATGGWTVEWAANYRFVADDPLKATIPKDGGLRSHVLTALRNAMSVARHDITIISPYFVPGAEGARGLVRAVRDGVGIRILTNSLVANDVPAVHGGYARHRRELLAGGVELWELKPMAGEAADQSLGSSGASLHSKALVVDEATSFIGSYNLDPRSTWLNCEQGVLVESPKIAQQLKALFERQTGAESAWRVQIEDNELRWSDGTETFERDPLASWMRRFQAWTARVLHLDAQL